MVDPTHPHGQTAEPASHTAKVASREATSAADIAALGPVKAASVVVRALTQAASSFLLYDASNEAIAGFLVELRDSLHQFLTTFGSLELEIRPWDLTFQQQVVYVDRDREHSLAFRLYKDGVRKLVIHPAVTWEEIIELLGILAVRAKGIRQHEDDVVTMLWNASFKHIETEAVEGLVAEDDERIGELEPAADTSLTPRSALQAAVFSAPYAFDYPLPPLAERAPVLWRPIPEASFERLRQQDGTEGLAIECGQLAIELVELMSDESNPLTLDDVVPTLREIRGYLLANSQFRMLWHILRSIHERAPSDPNVRARLFGSVADKEAWQQMLNACGTRQELSLTELGELLAWLPGDHMPVLLEFLATHPDGIAHQLGLRLLEEQARNRPDALAERLLANREAADLELLRVLERVHPETAVGVALELVGAKAAPVQLAALGVLARAPYGAKVGRAVVGALRANTEEVRRKALEILVAHKERRAYDTLFERFVSLASGSMSLAEAAAWGEAMARLEPERARKQLSEWVRPPGLLGRLANVPLPLRWGGVAGLAVLGGKDARDVLSWLAEKSSGELQQFCHAALQKLAAREERRTE